MTDDVVSLRAITTARPTTAADDFYHRVRAVEPEVHAFVDRPDRERLVREAAELPERFADARPPLYGAPIGVKDVIRADGFPTRAGSDLPAAIFDGPEAEAVTRLRRAGALIAGKTVTTEFAYFEPGPTRNPRDLDHTPGGSSSGSAAAVAAGICPLTLGTQTVGSVIRPAAFCGVVGYKPSFGRIPTGGTVPFAPSADHVGVFARSVADAATAAAVLCDAWSEAEPPNRPTIGVPDGSYLDQADPEGRQQFETGVERLSSAGYEIRRASPFDDIRSVNERHRTMIAAEMALTHDEWFARFGDRYAPVTADLIREGSGVRVGTLVNARNGRSELRDRLHNRMDDDSIDLWAAPAAPGPAPRGLDDTGDPVMNLPWTHAGLPVVSVPAGSSAGLPVGMQCIARFGADETLLAWCSTLAEILAAGA